MTLRVAACIGSYGGVMRLLHCYALSHGSLSRDSVAHSYFSHSSVSHEWQQKCGIRAIAMDEDKVPPTLLVLSRNAG